MKRMRRLAAIAIAIWAATAAADEFRAYWVDTFHTPLGTHADIDRAIELAAQSHANAIFVEVRRRIRKMCAFTTRSSCERILFAAFKRMNDQWTLHPLNTFTQNN